MHNLKQPKVEKSCYWCRHFIIGFTIRIATAKNIIIFPDGCRDYYKMFLCQKRLGSCFNYEVIWLSENKLQISNYVFLLQIVRAVDSMLLYSSHTWLQYLIKRSTYALLTTFWISMRTGGNYSVIVIVGTTKTSVCFPSIHLSFWVA